MQVLTQPAIVLYGNAFAHLGSLLLCQAAAATNWLHPAPVCSRVTLALSGMSGWHVHRMCVCVFEIGMLP
jgi:hypothetical protein